MTINEAVRGEGHFQDTIDLPRVHLLRGRVLVRKIEETHPLLTLIEEAPRAKKIHRGRVVAMGQPARDKWHRDVPPGFAVGDEVLFVFAVALENVRAFGEGIVCVAQEEVQATIDRAGDA